MPIVKTFTIEGDLRDFSLMALDNFRENPYFDNKELRALLADHFRDDQARMQFLLLTANRCLFLKSLVRLIERDRKFLDDEQNIKTLEVKLLPFKSRVKNDPSQFDVSDLSFEMSKDDASRITSNILQIVRDPNLVLDLLRHLDSELGKKMQESGICVEDNSPDYFVTGLGQFVPGPWPENWRPLNKGKILDKLLLEREQREGVNLDGVAVFSTLVDPKIANTFVAEGNIFSEDERSGGFVLDHGKKSHRLMLEIMRQAVLSGALNLKLESGNILNHKQLLEFLAKAYIDENNQTEEKTNIFQITIDNVGDTYEAGTGFDKIKLGADENSVMFNPAQYCFSSRSPSVLKSLIMCLGRDVLPSLAFYLLDSHYKLSLQSVRDIKTSLGNLRFKNDEEISKIFDLCKIKTKDFETLDEIGDRRLVLFAVLDNETTSTRNPSGFNRDKAFSRADPLYCLPNPHALSDLQKSTIMTRYQALPKKKADGASAGDEHWGWGIVSKKPYPKEIDPVPVGSKYPTLEDYLAIKAAKEEYRMTKSLPSKPKSSSRVMASSALAPSKQLDLSTT